ncbi:MAG: aminopeptidase [Flavobacteriaceae bacterium]|nr:aminopeptidase [Flavobacteriaceae bacterium]
MKSILPFIFAFVITATFAQTDKEKVENTVSKSKIEGHIYFLADDLLKGRQTGTPENKIAASYIANTLKSYGVQPNPETGDYYQQIPLVRNTPPKDISLTINGIAVPNKVALKAENITYDGQAVYVNYGMEADYVGKDVKGKVVVMKAGSEEAKDARGAFGLVETKRELAKKAGAKAIIELLNSEDQMWGFVSHNFDAPSMELGKLSAETNKKETLSHLWVQDKNHSLATDIASKRGLFAQLKMKSSKKEQIYSQNVIGVVAGSDPKLKNEYIIYSAHYDHVGVGTPDETGDTIYNGARDNAVGVTTVLSMAENLAKYPTKRSALFILFTGEEMGLLGSSYYVDNPVLPLNQMVYCFNSDNGGYNDTSKATIVGLQRTTAENNIKNAVASFGLTAIDDPAPEQGLFDRSDNVHFAKKGIPAPTFSMGFTSFDGEVTKYYHRPGDHADSMDYDYLLKFFSAYVMAGRSIANDPVTPFWIKGDTYEAAGRMLYKTKKVKK